MAGERFSNADRDQVQDLSACGSSGAGSGALDSGVPDFSGAPHQRGAPRERHQGRRGDAGRRGPSHAGRRGQRQRHRGGGGCLQPEVAGPYGNARAHASLWRERRDQRPAGQGDPSDSIGPVRVKVDCQRPPLKPRACSGKNACSRDFTMRILIADDHPVVRRGLKEILAAEHDMIVVGEAKSGLDLVKEIKRQYPGRPVLVLSMLPEEVHATQVFKAGGAGYITKESASEELTTAIRKVMNGGKYVSPGFAEKMVSELAPDAEKPLHETLSDREYRVMWLLASGKQINQIAAEMFLSPSTISTYRARILKKLKLTDNAALVRYAVKQQLI